MNNNALSVLFPYRFEGTWVFDDESVGLKREPFVCGIEKMLDRLVAKIPDAEQGFRLIFSANPFPGYNVELQWKREEYGGNWYFSPELQSEGWLCPALFKYFTTAPAKLFGRVEPKNA